MTTIELILYSKPDCHLCEGLLEKLEKIRQPDWQLEIRDITSREDWFNAYQYEIPVLCQKLATGKKSFLVFPPGQMPNNWPVF